MEPLEHTRRARRMTRRQLADLAGVSRQMVYQYERRGAVPALAVARRLAEVLGVSVDRLWPPDGGDRD